MRVSPPEPEPEPKAPNPNPNPNEPEPEPEPEQRGRRLWARAGRRSHRRRRIATTSGCVSRRPQPQAADHPQHASALCLIRAMGRHTGEDSVACEALPSNKRPYGFVEELLLEQRRCAICVHGHVVPYTSQAFAFGTRCSSLRRERADSSGVCPLSRPASPRVERSRDVSPISRVERRGVQPHRHTRRINSPGHHIHRKNPNTSRST